MRYLSALALIVSMVLAVTGCSGPIGPKVKGQVLFDGTPVEGARVVFEGEGGGIAVTNSEGKFAMDGTTFKTVKPGKYLVRISRYVDKKTGKAPSEEDHGQLLAANALKNMLPEKYDAREENTNIVEIKDGMNELPPFQLKK